MQFRKCNLLVFVNCLILSIWHSLCLIRYMILVDTTHITWCLNFSKHCLCLSIHFPLYLIISLHFLIISWCLLTFLIVSESLSKSWWHLKIFDDTWRYLMTLNIWSLVKRLTTLVVKLLLQLKANDLRCDHPVDVYRWIFI